MDMKIRQGQILDCLSREIEWFQAVQETKITADNFYHSHRLSALGEAVYRHYIITKLEYISKYTDVDNHHNAMQAIVLGKNTQYSVPIEFTRYIIQSIEKKTKLCTKIVLHSLNQEYLTEFYCLYGNK